MHRLIAKIFIAYWLAAGVVIAISDFEPHRHIHNPELTDALDASLAANARTILHAYETGGCASATSWLNTAEHGMYLASPEGRVLYGTLDPASVSQLIAVAAKDHKRTTDNHALFQMIAVPFAGHDGKSYILLFKNSYSSALQVYGLLPGYTTIAISAVVTLFLAILVAFPIRRLRKAVRRIASGNLETRIRPGAVARFVTMIRIDDDIDGLVHDFNSMAEQLQSLVTAQKLLLRDVSHELRSPLARLAVALELTREGPFDTRETHLDRIERESICLNTLIGRILTFSYIESIREVPHTNDLCLASLVRELLPDMQYEADARQCQVTTTAAGSCMIRGDADMLSIAWNEKAGHLPSCVYRTLVRVLPTRSSS
jgi:two-component system sensor histidine kinase CpxA